MVFRKAIFYGPAFLYGPSFFAGASRLSIYATKSFISQSRVSIPAAIAGDILSVECAFTKLQKAK